MRSLHWIWQLSCGGFFSTCLGKGAEVGCPALLLLYTQGSVGPDPSCFSALLVLKSSCGPYRLRSGSQNPGTEEDPPTSGSGGARAGWGTGALRGSADQDST